MQLIFDVAVMGGGPAGAVTALCLARRGVRVALVEATNFAGDRYGETLPPEMNPVLRELGLWEPFTRLDSLPSSGIVSSWGSRVSSAQDFVFNAHGCGWHIDRNRFDSLLCQEAAAAGATLRLGTTNRPPAKLLVDATGRSGLRLEPDHEYERDDRLLAIALRLDAAPTADRRTVIESTPQGWWYSAPIPGGQTIAMFFTDPEVYAREGIVIGEQLSHAPVTQARLATARLLTSRIVPVASSCRRKLLGDGWISVGDSASAYDPLSGRGIFKAFRHGAALAEAIVSGTTHAYAAGVRRDYDEYVRQRRAFYASERRWPEAAFWQPRRYPHPRDPTRLTEPHS